MMRLLLLLVFVLPLAAQLPQPSRALFEIRMDEGSGKELADNTGNGNNWCRGQDWGSPTCPAIARNECVWDTDGGEAMLSCNGVDQWIRGGNLSGAFGSGQGTVCATWRLVNDTPTEASKTGSWLVGSPGNITEYPWTSGLIAEMALRAVRFTGVDDGAFDKSEWHTYCVTHEDGAGNYILYQNGSALASTAGESSINYPTAGEMGRSQSTRYLEGDMAHSALWDIVLMPQETADYHCYSRGLKPGLAMTDIGCVAAVPGPGLLSVISLASAGAPAAETTTPCASFAPTEWAAAGLPLDPFDVDATATQYGDACLPLLPPMPSRVTVP